MYKRNKTILAATITSLFLAGCGGSSSDTPKTPVPNPGEEMKFIGKVIDTTESATLSSHAKTSMLSAKSNTQGKVFFDINYNGKMDSGELSGDIAADGSFRIDLTDDHVNCIGYAPVVADFSHGKYDLVFPPTQADTFDPLIISSLTNQVWSDLQTEYVESEKFHTCHDLKTNDSLYQEMKSDIESQEKAFAGIYGLSVDEMYKDFSTDPEITSLSNALIKPMAISYDQEKSLSDDVEIEYISAINSSNEIYQLHAINIMEHYLDSNGSIKASGSTNQEKIADLVAQVGVEKATEITWLKHIKGSQLGDGANTNTRDTHQEFVFQMKDNELSDFAKLLSYKEDLVYNNKANPLSGFDNQYKEIKSITSSSDLDGTVSCTFTSKTLSSNTTEGEIIESTMQDGVIVFQNEDHQHSFTGKNESTSEGFIAESCSYFLKNQKTSGDKNIDYGFDGNFDIEYTMTTDDLDKESWTYGEKAYKNGFMYNSAFFTYEDLSNIVDSALDEKKYDGIEYHERWVNSPENRNAVSVVRVSNEKGHGEPYSLERKGFQQVDGSYIEMWKETMFDSENVVIGEKCQTTTVHNPDYENWGSCPK